MNAFRASIILAISFFVVACGDSGPVEPPEPTSALTTAPPADTSCVLVMGWDPWEPYQYEIAGGQVFGLDVDLVSAIVSHAGCELTYRRGNWRDLLQMLREGEVDLLAGATVTPEREAFAQFTQPYREEAFHLFVPDDRQEEAKGISLPELLDAGWRIGVVEDYLYGNPVSQLQDDSRYADQFVYAAMSEVSLSWLFNRAVDAVIEDRYVGAAVLRRKDLQGDVAVRPEPLTTNPVSLMVSRESVDSALFEKLDGSVSTLQSNGAIEKILNQYWMP